MEAGDYTGEVDVAEHTGYNKELTHWVQAEGVRQCAERKTAGLQLQI